MSLHIAQISLLRFRSHTRAMIETDARPVVIFGANGAGKTSALEAVSLLSPGRGLRRASADDMAQRPAQLGWKIEALVTSGAGLYEVETSAQYGTARSVRVDGKPAAQTRLAQLIRVLWLVPMMDRLWIEGAEGRRRFLDRMTLSFEPGHAQLSLDYDKAMRERNRLLKDMVRDPAWYRALNTQLAETGAAIHRNRLEALAEIAAAQSQASSDFPAAELELIHPAPSCADPADANSLHEALEQSHTSDLAAGRTLVGPHRADLMGTYATKSLPARDCSTGEQKALLVSLILANARALSARFGAPPLLLLDEVAAHLDASRRAALYDEIAELGAQAWMTGTGPELFEALGPRAQYLEVTESGGVSEVHKR